MDQTVVLFKDGQGLEQATMPEHWQLSLQQAGFAVPHSSLTIGWVGIGTLGWG